jgi:preprotein translocase subunit SecG
MLYYAIATLHVIVCIILVLVVLLQSGKGADLAGAFGGGATQTAFGSRGPASFLSKMTTAAAVVFMVTSISLSMISATKPEAKSVLETDKQETVKQEAEKPAKTEPATQPLPVETKEDINRQLEEMQKARQKQQAAPDSNPAKSEKPAQ